MRRRAGSRQVEELRQCMLSDSDMQGGNDLVWADAKALQQWSMSQGASAQLLLQLAEAVG